MAVSSDNIPLQPPSPASPPAVEDLEWADSVIDHWRQITPPTLTPPSSPPPPPSSPADDNIPPPPSPPAAEDLEWADSLISTPTSEPPPPPTSTPTEDPSPSTEPTSIVLPEPYSPVPFSFPPEALSSPEQDFFSSELWIIDSYFYYSPSPSP
ncbi:hypothetical protein CASFOL_040740 [Castilleja foliolosa]|uniref:Uncharacterized protein n=1 Tax=Castilleja foliolosa TaxID=1961234 RepID=A0ABD3BD43_9LAMI